jgi:hypothetical protein
VEFATLPGLGAFDTVLAFGTTNTNKMVDLFYSGSTAQFKLTDWAAGVSLVTTGTKATGTPYHLIATYDGTTVSLYQNGVLIASAAYAFNITASVADIGNDSAGDYFSGVIDEVALYNYALTATQVAAHYTAGSFLGLTVNQRTLINERINYMNPPLIRTCANSVSWWCPSGVVGTYNFYTPLMLEWYQVFENAQQNGINVIVGVNSPAPFNALSADWCTAFAALIDQLVNNSSYTCVKYVSGLSEPDTLFH